MRNANVDNKVLTRRMPPTMKEASRKKRKPTGSRKKTKPTRSHKKPGARRSRKRQKYFFDANLRLTEEKIQTSMEDELRAGPEPATVKEVCDVKMIEMKYRVITSVRFAMANNQESLLHTQKNQKKLIYM